MCFKKKLTYILVYIVAQISTNVLNLVSVAMVAALIPLEVLLVCVRRDLSYQPMVVNVKVIIVQLLYVI